MHEQWETKKNRQRTTRYDTWTRDEERGQVGRGRGRGLGLDWVGYGGDM
jgi:hypothetical protein